MDGNAMHRNRARYREIACSLDIDIQLLVTSNNRFKMLLRGWKKITECRMETRWKEDFIDTSRSLPNLDFVFFLKKETTNLWKLNFINNS